AFRAVFLCPAVVRRRRLLPDFHFLLPTFCLLLSNFFHRPMNNNPPLASERHLFGFFLILAGIATASWLMARHPFSHRFLLYLTLIAMELLRVWYVIAGARANGNGVMNIVGRGWTTWRDAARDCLLAIGTIVAVAGTARALVCLLCRWSPDPASILP